MNKAAALLFVVASASPSLAFAQQDPHTGFNLGANLGFQNVRGNFFRNDVKPGPSFKFDLGWRITSMFSLESGLAIATGQSEGLDETVTFIHIFNLDARFFPLGAGKLEPNLLAGWTLGSGAAVEVGETTFTYTGYSPTLGAGARFHVNDRLYVQGDFRYLYTRLTDYEVSGGGFEGSGSLQEQGHGDSFHVLFGAGVQF